MKGWKGGSRETRVNSRTAVKNENEFSLLYTSLAPDKSLLIAEKMK